MFGFKRGDSSPGERDPQLKELRSAVAADPGSAELQQRLFNRLQALDLLDEAVRVAGEAVRLYRNASQPEAALKVCDQLAILSPELVEPRLTAAELAWQLGRREDARRRWAGVTASLVEKGQWEAALAQLEQRAHDDHARSARHQVELAELHRGRPDADAAKRWYRSALTLLLRTREVSAYVDVAERHLELASDDTEVGKELASFLLERGDASRGVVHLERCFRINAEDEETLELLRRTFEALGQTQREAVVLERIVRQLLRDGMLEVARERLARLGEIAPARAQPFHDQLSGAEAERAGPGRYRSGLPQEEGGPRTRLVSISADGGRELEPIPPVGGKKR